MGNFFGGQEMLAAKEGSEDLIGGNSWQKNTTLSERVLLSASFRNGPS
jgi:hypothetical protein